MEKKNLFADAAIRIRQSLAGSQYLKDVLWQASGNTAAQMLGILIMPVLTRLYSPSDFAVLNLFSQSVIGLSIIMTLRFEYLVMLPTDEREAQAIVRLIFWLGAFQVAFWTPFLFYLPNHWVWLHKQGEFANWLWMTPVSAWLACLAIGFQQIIQRSGNFRVSGGSEFAGRCAYVITTVLGALALPNLFGLLVSACANATAKLSWLSRSHSGLLQMVFKPSSQRIAKTIHRMAISTSMSNLIALTSGIGPMLFIANQYGAHALGQYSLVVATLYLPSTLLGQAIGQVYYQRACKLHGGGLPFASLLKETSRNLAKLSLPLYTVIALLSPIAYPAIFGASWTEAGALAPWLCITAAAGFFSTPLDRTSLIVNAWWYLSTWNAFRAISTLLIIWWSQRFNLGLHQFVAALAIQLAIAYAIDWIASWQFSKRVLSRR